MIFDEFYFRQSDVFSQISAGSTIKVPTETPFIDGCGYWYGTQYSGKLIEFELPGGG